MIGDLRVRGRIKKLSPKALFSILNEKGVGRGGGDGGLSTRGELIEAGIV